MQDAPSCDRTVIVLNRGTQSAVSQRVVVVALCPGEAPGNHIPGFAGTTLSCFIQVFYVVFLFPLLAMRLEMKSARLSH